MLATGNVPVRYTELADGFRGTDQTVDMMRQVAMGRYGARSPKIRALARNIIQRAGVAEKDYTGEAYALATWVRDRIRYMKDVYGQETISQPEEVAFNMRAGDCDDQSALLAALLGSVGIPSRFKVIGVTPHQYSHVYLQARPGKKWITFDPIMSDKQCGWEVPQYQRAIEKAYPINGIDGWINTGVNGMDGLGYVGDPRVVSHLQQPTIPYGAGSGRRPPASQGHPAYVQMPSLLDTDAPVDHLIHYHPNQNAPRRTPPAGAAPIDPRMQRLTNQGVRHQATAAAMEAAAAMDGLGMDPAERAAFHGQNQVIGPDQIAGMSTVGAINSQSVPAYMQTVTVAQQPEGVDDQFARAALVVDPNKGDKVLYDGYWDDPMQKPNIRPVTGVQGIESNPKDMLPGMGYLGEMAGPGMGVGATGTEANAQDPIPAGAPPAPVSTGRWIGVAALAGLAFWLYTRRS